MLALLLRDQQPQLASVLALGAGVILLLWALPQIEQVKAALTRIASLGGLETGYLQTMLKVLLIAYVTELAAQTCQDMGQGGLALKAALLGKMMIFAIAAPLMVGFVELILGLLP